MKSLKSLIRRKKRQDHAATYVQLFLGLSIVSLLYLTVYYGQASNAITEIPIDQRRLLGIILAVHLGLYWLSPKLNKKPLVIVAYMVLQLAILSAMSFLLNASVITAFNAPLVGETLIVFDSIGLLLFDLVIAYGCYFAVTMVLYHVSWDYLIPGFVVSVVLTFPYFGILILQTFTRRHSDQLLAQLHIAHRQLTRYADQIEELTLTAERARIARDLHDTLAQGVAGMSLQLEALEGSLLKGDSARSMAILAQVKTNARVTLTTSRQAIDELRLVMPPRGNNIEAVQQEVERFFDLYGISYTLNINRDLQLDESYTEPLLRCLKEGLSNVGRHAHATHVEISIQAEQHSDKRYLVLQIKDNGIGFNVKSHKAIGHYGLIGMDEQARLIGGSLDLISTVGNGTTLCLKLPITEGGHKTRQNDHTAIDS